MQISIIIVTYNSLSLLPDCFKSINQYNDLNNDEIEIILVDNSPKPNAVQIENFVKNLSYSFDIQYIKSENKGYGYGNNIGIRNAKGKIAAIMNPDVRLIEPVFKKVIEIFEDTEVASLGFKQINGSTNFSYYRFPELYTPIIYTFLNRRANRNHSFNQKKYSLSGAFVFFRISHFYEIGLYDENMYMYLEEPDTAKRINNLKKKIIFDPSLKYLHLMEQKDDFNERLLDIGTNSISIYFKKNKLNLNKYLRLRILELRIHKIIFKLLRNTPRVKKAEAYIKSLSKEYDK